MAMGITLAQNQLGSVGGQLFIEDRGLCRIRSPGVQELEFASGRIALARLR
jgi:hypothetical protein